MTNINSFVPIVQKFFEYDMSAVVQRLESMNEKDATAALESLPPSLSVHIIKYLQIRFAAVSLKDSGDFFTRNVVLT